MGVDASPFIVAEDELDKTGKGRVFVWKQSSWNHGVWVKAKCTNAPVHKRSGRIGETAQRFEEELQADHPQAPVRFVAVLVSRWIEVCGTSKIKV